MALTPKLLLLLGKLMLHLAHLGSDSLIGVHLHTLSQKPTPEYEEKGRGEETGEAARNESRDRLAEDSGQDGHDKQGAKGSGKDYHPVVLHGHEGSDQKGLVAHLGEENHGEGEHEGVEGLDDALLVVFQWLATRMTPAGLGIDVEGALLD